MSLVQIDPAPVVASQSMRALEKANEVRLARCALKRDIGDGSQAISDVLLTVPSEADTMKLFDLLTAQPRWSNVRARQFMRSFPMGEDRLIGAMTERERYLAARVLRRDSDHAAMLRDCPVCRAEPGDPCLKMASNANSEVTAIVRADHHPDRRFA